MTYWINVYEPKYLGDNDLLGKWWSDVRMAEALRTDCVIYRLRVTLKEKLPS